MNRIRRILALCLLGCSWALAACSSDDDPAPPPPACGEGMETCDGVCRDITKDPLHCGACGAACGEWEACDEGECVVSCPAERENCEGSCVDLATDTANCGACGTACKADEQCAAGSCAPACSESEVLCEGACVDLRSDDAHCGKCGMACADGLSCVDKVCQLVCAGEEVVCGGTCVDLDTDKENCGVCGHACKAEEVCEDKVCTCPAGMDDCGLGCIDITENVNHCGGCNIPCLGRPNAVTGVCKESLCDFQCDPGYADCDKDPTNGCETYVLEDADNCGACGESCYTANVKEAACVAETCSILECEAGWANCDGDPASGAASGCETDVLTNAEHCGQCGINCLNLPGTNNDGSCDAGTCAFTCAAGFQDCDEDPLNGCEVNEANFDDSLEHCGGCNIACGGGEACIAGVCTPDYAKANWPLPPDGPTDYKDNGATVTDNVTGLIWQKGVAPNKMNWEDALAYCGGDPLGDGEAWRLPTVMELTSILDNTRNQPAINTDFFTDTPTTFPTADFWTSSANVNLADQYWSINFAFGAIAYKKGDTNEYSVRCVRGGKWEAGERYVLTEETVEDLKTGLVWQRVLDVNATNNGLDQNRDYLDANARCEDKVLAGKDDWRLPTQKEQASIVDWSQYNPSIDTVIFPDTPARPFWSSTTASHIQNPVTGWIMNFTGGANQLVGHNAMAGEMQGVHVRCVRNAD